MAVADECDGADPEEALMGDVVQLFQPAEPKSGPEGTRFFCQHCDTDQFAILETGWIYCAGCGRSMSNIFCGLRNT